MLRHAAVAIAAALLPVSAAIADHFQVRTHIEHHKRTDRTFAALAGVSAPRAIEPAAGQALPPEVAARAQGLMARGSRYSLLLLQNGSLVFEGYANGADARTLLTAMSVSKSMVALAVGEALCAGKIADLDAPAGRYAPALAHTAFGRASIRDLLTMRSGASQRGIEGWMGVNQTAYLEVHTGKTTILEYIARQGVQETRFGTPVKPGELFHYSGYDTKSLAIAVEGAAGEPFPAWFGRSVWTKSGAEGPGYWQTDREGKALADGFFIASARDHARIALYFLDRLRGAANDPCVSKFALEATRAHVASTGLADLPQYGYQMWIRPDGRPAFEGHGGQYVLFDVATQRVLVSHAQKADRTSIVGLFESWLASR